MQKLLIFSLFAFFLAFFVQKAEAQQPVAESAEEVEMSDEEFEEMLENGGEPQAAPDFEVEKIVARPALPEPQDGPARRNFDQSSYEKAVAGVDYSSDFEKPEKPKIDSGGSGFRFPDWDFGAGASFVKWLFILAGVVLIGWMIFNSIGGPSSRSLGQPLDVSDLDDLEDRFQEANFEKMARDAAEKGQIALAVRLYFLAVLKGLSRREALVWKKEKTNRDYLRELSGSLFQTDFRAAALVFDRVWYGEEAVSSDDFEQKIRPVFESFLQKIG